MRLEQSHGGFDCQSLYADEEDDGYYRGDAESNGSFGVECRAPHWCVVVICSAFYPTSSERHGWVGVGVGARRRLKSC